MNSRVSNLYIGNPNENATDQRLAVQTSVVSFSDFHADTDYVVLDIQDANVMVTFDGSNPSSSNGHMLVKEQGLIAMSVVAGKAMKLIREDATDAAVHLTEFVD